MYITFLAGSPCAKTGSFLPYSATFLPRPVESRNNFTSKARIPGFAFLLRRGTPTDTLRPGEGIDANNSRTSIPKTVQYCTVSAGDVASEVSRLTPRCHADSRHYG